MPQPDNNNDVLLRTLQSIFSRPKTGSSESSRGLTDVAKRSGIKDYLQDDVPETGVSFEEALRNRAGPMPFRKSGIGSALGGGTYSIAEALKASRAGLKPKAPQRPIPALDDIHGYRGEGGLRRMGLKPEAPQGAYPYPIGPTQEPTAEDQTPPNYDYMSPDITATPRTVEVPNTHLGPLEEGRSGYINLLIKQMRDRMKREGLNR